MVVLSVSDDALIFRASLQCGAGWLNYRNGRPLYRCARFTLAPATLNHRPGRGRLDSRSLSFLTTVMNLSDLSAAQLRRAAALKERVEKLHKELAKLLGAPAAPPAPTAAPKKQKRKMSAKGRANIAAAAKARWAKIKGSAKPAESPRKKVKISAAGIARIKAAQKARWAKIKAAQKKK